VVLNHPPASPLRAPCNCTAHQKLKTYVKGSNLELLQDIHRNATFVFARLSGSDFRQCFQIRQRNGEGNSSYCRLTNKQTNTTIPVSCNTSQDVTQKSTTYYNEASYQNSAAVEEGVSITQPLQNHGLQAKHYLTISRYRSQHRACPLTCNKREMTIKIDSSTFSNELRRQLHYTTVPTANNTATGFESCHISLHR
jgi:hypothetical protein